MNQSVEFLKVIDEVQKREIPEYVLRRAKQSLLDYLAVSSAGAVFQKEKIDNYMGFAMPELGEFNAIGTISLLPILLRTSSILKFSSPHL